MKLGSYKRKNTPSFSPKKPKKSFLEKFLLVTGVLSGIKVIIDTAISIIKFFENFL